MLVSALGVPVVFRDATRLALLLSAALLAALALLCLLLLLCRGCCACAEWRQRRRYALFELEVETRALFSELGEL